MAKEIIQNNVICGKGTLYNPPIKIICPLNDTVEFGNFCAIGPNLKILGINHDYNFASIQHTFYKKYFNKEHPISSISNVSSKGKIKIGHDDKIKLNEHFFLLDLNNIDNINNIKIYDI